jgi:hypothetical protein
VVPTPFHVSAFVFFRGRFLVGGEIYCINVTKGRRKLAICCNAQSSSLSQSCAAQHTLSTHSVPSFVNSSVNWGCRSLNYPIGPQQPRPSLAELSEGRRYENTPIRQIQKRHPTLSYLGSTAAASPKTFVSLGKFTAFTITENSIAISSYITFKMDLPRESPPQEHCSLKGVDSLLDDGGRYQNFWPPSMVAW